MGRDAGLAELGFTSELYPAGTHMCLIYSDERERRRIIGEYLDSGFRGGERVSYFADMMAPEEVRAWLEGMGVELPGDDAFSIRAAEQTYCPLGEFVPQGMLDTVRGFHGQAREDGYERSRVSGEMSWALRGIPGSDRLMEYESLLNDVLVTHPVTAICQYDANRFDGAAILDVLKVHPMTIVHGQVVPNPYYMKPREYLRAAQSGHGFPG